MQASPSSSKPYRSSSSTASGINPLPQQPGVEGVANLIVRAGQLGAVPAHKPGGAHHAAVSFSTTAAVPGAANTVRIISKLSAGLL